MNLKNALRSASYFIYRWIKGKDIFSQEIKLTYKGKEDYKTLCGGLWSLLIMLLMLIYAGNLFMNIPNHTNSTNTVSTIHTNIVDDPTEYMPYMDGFMFGVAIMDLAYNPLEIDEQILNLRLTNQIVNTTGLEIIFNGVDLGYHYGPNELIGLEKFSYDGKSYNKIMCPNITDYRLQGGVLSDQSISINIELLECTENGKSDDEISDFINNLYISIVLIEYYVDFHDFENPIKYYVNQDNGFVLSPNFLTSGLIYIQQDQVDLQDSWIHFNDNVHRKIWTFSKINVDKLIKYDRGAYFGMTIFIDSKSSNYKRVSYSIMDVIANIGGVYGIIHLFSTLLISYFSSNSLLFDMIQSLYYTTKENNLESISVCASQANRMKTRISNSINDLGSFGISKSRIRSDTNVSLSAHIEEVKNEALSEISITSNSRLPSSHLKFYRDSALSANDLGGTKLHT